MLRPGAHLLAALRSGDTQLKPVSYVDPATKHIIFRGAGRVRFRHEMEDTFAIYHDHYFEDRTFEYILDDSIPAGGTTITVTFLPNANQYYSKQTLAPQQQGGADLNIRAWKIYGGVDGNAFATNAGGASNNVLPTGCTPDPNSPNCNTQKYSFVINQQHCATIAPSRWATSSRSSSASSWRATPPRGAPIRETFCPCPRAARSMAALRQRLLHAGQLLLRLVPLRRRQGHAHALQPRLHDDRASRDGEQLPASLRLLGQRRRSPRRSPPARIPDRTGPDEAGWSGGTATQSYIRQRHDLYYSQMSPNILGENAANFAQGRRLFHIDYTTGKHIEVNNDLPPEDIAVHAGIAGPLLNQVACEGCHSHNNRGVPPAAGMPFDSVVVKLAGMGKDANGAPEADPNYGHQLQNKAISGTAEGSASFTYATVNGMFKDGTAYTLTKPTTTFSGLTAGNPAAYSVRLARPLIGMGLLESIPEADILAHADPTDCNKDGIKGIPNLVFDPEDGTMKIGRFGWKASKASVRHQVAEALNLDIGVTTSVFPKHDCGTNQASCKAADKATPELSDSDLNLLVTYMRDLGVPPRRDIKNATVMRGETLFAQLGCANCHAPNQRTGNDVTVPRAARPGHSPVHRSAPPRHGRRSRRQQPRRVRGDADDVAHAAALGHRPLRRGRRGLPEGSDAQPGAQPRPLPLPARRPRCEADRRRAVARWRGCGGQRQGARSAGYGPRCSRGVLEVSVTSRFSVERTIGGGRRGALILSPRPPSRQGFGLRSV